MINEIEKDLKYNWHPYTQMKDCQKNPPILIEKAKGLKLFDQAGNYYYDTISSWWCNIHGHNHPKINKAIQNQLKSFDHIMFGGFTHLPAIELAEKLVNIAPGNLSRVFYSDNGSTSVEVALKMSVQYWQHEKREKKTKFIHLEHGYHGDTIGTMSISGISLFKEVFNPLLFSAFQVPVPYKFKWKQAGKNPENAEQECLETLEKILKKHHQETAAMIMEPLVMGAGGMIMTSREYLSKVRELTEKYEVHLILDEVAVGFGRTGTMFACEQADIFPDFLCLSKGITSGTLPLAATLTTTKIYNAFYGNYEENKTFYHGHTYTANAIACAAANASLNIFEEEKTLAKVKKLIPYFEANLARFNNLAIIGEVRTIGLIGACELVKNKKILERFAFSDRIGYKIYLEGLKNNLILRPMGEVLYFYFPLCITFKEIETILAKTHAILKEM